VDWDEPIRVCVIQKGELTRVPVRYNPTSGDPTSLEGLPFSSVYPLTGEYASVAGWFVNREPITFRGHPYVLYARPRILGPHEITRVGEYRGVGVYAEAADTASAAQFIYLPTRSGCEFQPYAAPSELDQ